MARMTVGTAVAAPGERVRGHLAVPGVTEIPLTVVAGTRSGPTLLAMAGLHGGEWSSIAAAVRLARETDPAELTGTLVLLHVVDPPAFFGKVQYYCPLDGKNPNRVFPGSALGTAAERLAHAVMGVARTADAWIDMHGGDIHEALVPFAIYPGRGDDAVVARARRMAETYGLPHVVRDDSLAGMGCVAGVAEGIPSIIAEAGGAGRYDPAMEALHVAGVRRVMRDLGLTAGGPPDPAPFAFHPEFPWLRTSRRGMFFPAVGLGDRVVAGQPVGELRDLFGDPLEPYSAPATGTVLFIATSLPLVEGDPVLAVASD
jgi:predicted deacylase